MTAAGAVEHEGPGGGVEIKDEVGAGVIAGVLDSLEEEIGAGVLDAMLDELLWGMLLLKPALLDEMRLLEAAILLEEAILLRETTLLEGTALLEEKTLLDEISLVVLEIVLLEALLDAPIDGVPEVREEMMIGALDEELEV